MTAGRLASESGLSTGVVTTLVDRLERAGYVRRVRDEVDRRRVLVELTDAARARAGEIWGPIGQESAERMVAYSDAGLAFLLDFLKGSREFLARHLARIKEEPAEPGSASEEREPARSVGSLSEP